MNAEDAAKKMSQQFADCKSSTNVLLVDGTICVIDGVIARAPEKAEKTEKNACQWVMVAEFADNIDLRGCVILYRSVYGMWERLIVNDDKTITETQALGYGMTPEDAVKQLKDFEIQRNAD
jgi:hypothetical protein